jgi:hypothetical protein
LEKKGYKGYVLSAQDMLIIEQNVVRKRTLVELFVSILSVFSSFLDAREESVKTSSRPKRSPLE